MASYDPIPEIPKEEGASLDRMLAIVVVAVVACSVGVSIYLFLEVRSAQAEIASHSEQLQKYEEQFSQLAATEGRVNETLQKSARDFGRPRDPGRKANLGKGREEPAAIPRKDPATGEGNPAARHRAKNRHNNGGSKG